MSQLLGVSLKAIKSFEQGWRNIPMHIERQVLLLITMNKAKGELKKTCWATLKCPVEIRKNCPAWEFKMGHLCWFINGTICHGEVQESWQEKMKKCRKCKVLKPVLLSLED